MPPNTVMAILQGNFLVHRGRARVCHNTPRLVNGKSKPHFLYRLYNEKQTVQHDFVVVSFVEKDGLERILIMFKNN